MSIRNVIRPLWALTLFLALAGASSAAAVPRSPAPKRQAALCKQGHRMVMYRMSNHPGVEICISRKLLGEQGLDSAGLAQLRGLAALHGAAPPPNLSQDDDEISSSPNAAGKLYGVAKAAVRLALTALSLMGAAAVNLVA